MKDTSNIVSKNNYKYINYFANVNEINISQKRIIMIYYLA